MCARSMSPLCRIFNAASNWPRAQSRAPALEAQRGQGVDGRDVADVAAVVALHAPDRDQHAGWHAVARGGGVDFGAVQRQLFLAQRDALRADTALSR